MVVALGRIAARYSIRHLKNTLSNDSDKCTLFVKHLHTVIFVISHHDMVGAALNGELAKTIELAMVASWSTELGKVLAFHIKCLDSLIEAIADNNSVVFGINIDAIRSIELSVALAFGTEDKLWLMTKRSKFCIVVL